MTFAARFAEHFAACPLVAILRGVRPDEIIAVGDALIGAGFRLIEIPLNSPDPLRSIERLAAHAGDRATIGAGTVLTPGDVTAVRNAGGQLIVSPNTDTEVIAASVEQGLISLPGFFTPSEAFAAIKAGAHGLKLFPAELSSPKALAAMGAVLPKNMPILAVGGITPDGMAPWRSAGAAGFGLGSALYKVGLSPADVAERAQAFISDLAE